MNLFCTPSIDIGYLGSSFITGCFIGSFVFPRLADIIGRRPIFMLGLLTHIGVVIGSLFCTTIKFAYALLFFGGMAETMRYYVAYVYAVEMMPKRVQNDAGLYIFLVFGFVMTYIAL